MKAKMLEILNSVKIGNVSPEKAQSEILNLLDLEKRCENDEFLANVCLSYRHDFGLLSDDEQKYFIIQAKHWIRAIISNVPYTEDDSQ